MHHLNHVSDSVLAEACHECGIMCNGLFQLLHGQELGDRQTALLQSYPAGIPTEHCYSQPQQQRSNKFKLICGATIIAER